MLSAYLVKVISKYCHILSTLRNEHINYVMLIYLYVIMYVHQCEYIRINKYGCMYIHMEVNMTKHVALKDKIYEELDNLKPDKERSFSFVIKQLIDENKLLKEEIQRKDRIIEKYEMDII